MPRLMSYDNDFDSMVKSRYQITKGSDGFHSVKINQRYEERFLENHGFEKSKLNPMSPKIYLYPINNRLQINLPNDMNRAIDMIANLYNGSSIFIHDSMSNLFMLDQVLNFKGTPRNKKLKYISELNPLVITRDSVYKRKN